MYDYKRDKDFSFNDCDKLACTEIRAANLGAYCKGSFTYFNLFFKQHTNAEINKSCIQSVASEHMEMYYEKCAKNSINYVIDNFNKCYKDDSPINEIKSGFINNI